MLDHPCRLVLPAALLLLLAAGAPAVAGAAESPAAGWNERVQEIDRLLVEESYDRAFRNARRLVDEMAQRLGSGEGATRAMGTVAAQLALAEAGLGRLDDAAWHFSVALSFRPDLADVALAARHGSAGAALEARREAWEWPRRDREAPAADAAGSSHRVLAERRKLAEGEEPPRKRSSPAPQSTAGLRQLARSREVVVLQMLIEVDGSLQRPRILDQRFPGWAFVVTETVREWRFDPARQDGEPVAMPYLLTIDWTP